MSEQAHPAPEEEKVLDKPELTPENEEKEEQRASRLTMTLREAEIIAQNLKESGTRR